MVYSNLGNFKSDLMVCIRHVIDHCGARIFHMRGYVISSSLRVIADHIITSQLVMNIFI